MRWGGKETDAERRSRLSTFHRWFAWHPVRLDDTGQWAWMESVVRWALPASFDGDGGMIWAYRSRGPC